MILIINVETSALQLRTQSGVRQRHVGHIEAYEPASLLRYLVLVNTELKHEGGRSQICLRKGPISFLIFSCLDRP